MDKINNIYLNSENIEKIRTIFHSNRDLPSVTLPHLFEYNHFQSLHKEILQLKFKKIVAPIYYSYYSAPITKNLQSILSSNDFPILLNSIINKNIKSIKNNKIKTINFKKIDGTIACFGWKNYAILNDKIQEKPGIDIIIDFTHDWNEKCGGNIVYVDGSGTYTKIPASPNTLIIVERKNNVQKFVQYVNHRSGNKKRYLFLGTLQ